jgi:hypothetical protein
MIQAGCIHGKKVDAYKILTEKPKAKPRLRKSRSRRKGDIKMGFNMRVRAWTEIDTGLVAGTLSQNGTLGF